MENATINKIYPCAIIGGGLAGLCLAIQLAKQGVETLLFEKNKFPQHKVCGEYISMESWQFLSDLGVPLQRLNLPKINKLGVSSENGFMLESPLDLGGFGISRYSLDHFLCLIAREKGVQICENCKVLDVQKKDPSVSNAKNESVSEITTPQGTFYARIVCGSFGKYAPNFAKSETETATKNPNYIGVKYHIESNLAPNRIELHNFKDGYCGISKVDLNRYCLCYLSKSSNLHASGNDIKTMEETILYKNPHLKKHFTESTFLFDKPLVISNVYFHPKETYVNGIFMVGDSAGAITPLCGNGMSMAMRGSKLLADLLTLYFQEKLEKNALINQYDAIWKANFRSRIWAGNKLQHLFGKNTSTLLALKTLHYFPSLTRKVIGLTHGLPF